jgi:hypothetical protein
LIQEVHMSMKLEVVVLPVSDVGPDAGEWLQQATPTIRARVPLEVLRDTVQPFPTFSEIYVAALKGLRGEIRRSHEHHGSERVSRTA